MTKGERRLRAVEWMARLQAAREQLTDQQWQDLCDWYRSHEPGSVTTFDWPGWEPLIGVRPEPAGFTKKVFIPDAIRWEVWERDNFTCKKCGVRRYLSIDHIVPESKGGTLALDNLQTLCWPCNRAKGAR